MLDVMIDFETFGNGKNAAVVQVGACYFDRWNGTLGSTFKRTIDARTAVASGAELDADTVYWWLQQGENAVKSVTTGPLVDIYGAFNDLNIFLAGADRIWSHATFDFVILTETLKRLCIKQSFSHRVARDIRTLLDLSGYNYSHLNREGVHHDGLDDAIFQAKYCSEAFNKLLKEGMG